ncbi:MAG: MBL fold metallo-hydrolase [Clostridia bacterium]|nr:MBL fold metallo-hydrolase [Clostridia bacterium]
MKVTVLHDGSYASNCYLVTDDSGGAAVLIDPSVSPSYALRRVGALPRIDTILLTHGHFDHMLALAEWRELTGAPVAIAAEDAAALSDPYLSCYRTFLGQETTFAPPERLLAAGDTVAVGKEMLTVLSTPGHTPGSLTFDSGNLLFTGDTLFAGGGNGRSDLPGGNGDHLVASLRKLLLLPGERRLLAGHGIAGRLSEEKKHFNFS